MRSESLGSGRFASVVPLNIALRTAQRAQDWRHAASVSRHSGPRPTITFGFRRFGPGCPKIGGGRFGFGQKLESGPWFAERGRCRPPPKVSRSRPTAELRRWLPKLARCWQGSPEFGRAGVCSVELGPMSGNMCLALPSSWRILPISPRRSDSDSEARSTSFGPTSASSGPASTNSSE